MVENTEEDLPFPAPKYSFVPDSASMAKITGDAKSELLTYLTLAEKVEESTDLGPRSC